MNNNNQQTENSRISLLKGSAWMTLGSIFSRVLGAIYIIPWYAWMGTHGNVANALTAKSYNIYSLFLIISTAGIPGAVAKQVAKYNAINEYGIGRKLFKHGLFLMMIFGIVSAFVMTIASPILAGNDSRQIPVLHSLALAVLIIPILSIMRGYFQGYNDMMPSALSQLVEQIARVAWMLFTAYLIMQVQHGSYLTAVIQSNLAAAVGAFFGIALLVLFLLKRKSNDDKLILSSNNEIEVSTQSLFKEIIGQSVPFIIIDSGITFFQLMDQYTFHPIMNNLVHVSYDQIESWYALFGLNANKLIMVIVSLATAMAMTAIPLLSGAHAKKDYKDISRQIENTLELFLFFMIPASLGMAAVSVPVYTIFYGADPLGANILFLSGIAAMFLGAFTILMAILQGLSENGLAIKYLLIGIIIKSIFQWPAIKLFQVYGPLISTIIGLIFTITFALMHLRIKYKYNYKRTKKIFLAILIISLMMFMLSLIFVVIAGKLLNPEHRINALILAAGGSIIGGLFYFYITFKLKLAQKVMGNKVERLAKKLHIC